MVLYSAKDEYDKEYYGYCQVDTNKQALDKLKRQNLKDIKFYSDASVNKDVAYLKNMSQRDLYKRAKKEIKEIIGNKFIDKILSIMTNNLMLSLAFIIFVALFIYCVYIKYIPLAIVSGLIGLFLFFILFLPYILSSNYVKIHKAMNYGKWDEAEKKLNGFGIYGDKSFDDNINLELDTIGAKILAIKSSHHDAISFVEDKYGFIKDLSPIRYLILKASIYYINGEYDKRLEILKSISESYPDNMITLLDYFQAEAIFGNKDKASKMLDKIVYEEMIEYFKPNYDLIQGIIANDKDSSKAFKYFKDAYNKINQFKNNPLMLINLSIISGFYALALFDKNNEKMATDVLHPVWDVLKIHGHKSLLDDIYKKMPYFN